MLKGLNRIFIYNLGYPLRNWLQLKKSARSLLTLPTYVLRFGLKGGVYGRFFCKRIIGNLRDGWVVFWVLRVSWCHAREFDALTRITFPDLQQLLLALML
jgi:hypothetical protein